MKGGIGSFWSHDDNSAVFYEMMEYDCITRTQRKMILINFDVI